MPDEPPISRGTCSRCGTVNHDLWAALDGTGLLCLACWHVGDPGQVFRPKRTIGRPRRANGRADGRIVATITFSNDEWATVEPIWNYDGPLGVFLRRIVLAGIAAPDAPHDATQPRQSGGEVARGATE